MRIVFVSLMLNLIVRRFFIFRLVGFLIVLMISGFVMVSRGLYIGMKFRFMDKIVFSMDIILFGGGGGKMICMLLMLFRNLL